MNWSAVSCLGPPTPKLGPREQGPNWLATELQAADAADQISDFKNAERERGLMIRLELRNR